MLNYQFGQQLSRLRLSHHERPHSKLDFAQQTCSYSQTEINQVNILEKLYFVKATNKFKTAHKSSLVLGSCQPNIIGISLLKQAKSTLYLPKILVSFCHYGRILFSFLLIIISLSLFPQQPFLANLALIINFFWMRKNANQFL